MKAFIDRLLRKETMDGDGLCPIYLTRWTLFSFGWLKVYLHHFTGDDWTKDLHDHPKRFISIGLKGRYIEETPAGERLYQAPWIRSFPATHIHRLRLIDTDCWTIAIVLKTVRPWGFWHEGKWIPWRKYVQSEAAMSRKSC